MAANKSAMKRLKTDAKKHLRNKARKTEMKTFEKKLRAAVAEGDKEKAAELLKVNFAKLDKAVKSGTIHRNKGDRKKSRLAKLVSA